VPGAAAVVDVVLPKASNVAAPALPFESMVLRFRQGLQSYAVLARTLHFGRAAKELQLEQSTISTRIKRLEAELEVRLFRREGHAVHLTSAGQAFLRASELLLAQVDQAVVTTQQAEWSEAGFLAIGHISSAADRLIPRSVADFRAVYPDVKLSLKLALSEDQANWLLAGRLDIAFLRDRPTMPPLRSEAVSDGGLVACLPVGHRLAGETTVSLSALTGEPFVLFSVDCDPEPMLRAVLAGAGVVPNAVQEVDDPALLLGLVSAGIGITVLPVGMARGMPADIVTVRIADGFLRMYVAWDPRRVTPITEAFIGAVRRTAREFGEQDLVSPCGDIASLRVVGPDDSIRDLN
jgi:DNA-binding transcriptional LysR family regulator